MRNHSYNPIENPEAYANAIQRSIHGRANAKRARAWEAKYPVLAAWVNYTGYSYEPMTREQCEAEGVDYGSQNSTHTKHPLGPVPTFIRKAINEWGAPSEKATELLQRIYDERTANAAKRAEERAAEAASAQAWQPGRQLVEGVIISAKEVENNFGPRWSRPTTSWKILVKRQDGSKIYLTCPRSIEDVYLADSSQWGDLVGWLKGKRVRFTVTVEPKAEEPTFAFGSRPSKATIVEETK